MKVLVCGGGGYIGSHTVREIRRNTTWEVIILDNFSSGHWGTIPDDVIAEIGDIRNEAFLDYVFTKHKPDGVMHFCASIVVPDSVRDPLGYYDNNVVGTLRLLSVMRKHMCNKFIFSSTAALFGNPEKSGVPLKPDDPTKPESPYGDTKLIIEWLLRSCHVAYNLRYVCLRYFNACGADASGEIGERHEPETHLIPVVLEVALGKRKQMSIFGSDFNTKDGTCVRDYIHVTDLASAHIRALEYLQDDANPPNHFNLGTGVGSSVKEVVQAVESVTKRKLPVVMAGRREGDPAILIADPSKANTVLKWKAKITLTEMVQSAWIFHSKWDAIDKILNPFRTQETAKRILDILHREDQMHLFQEWGPEGTAMASKAQFFALLDAIDKAYAGGLTAYLTTARHLLTRTRDGVNPWAGYTASVPEVHPLTWDSTPNLHEVEALGAQTLAKCGFVLVAGGLGERLGYNGIKIALPVESVTGQTHLAHYLEYIKAWGNGPLCIMTSDDTHALTVELLRTLNITSGVEIIKQEKVPALRNNHAMMCTVKNQPYILDTKPHGNGDVHTLLYSSGIAQRWHTERGISHIVFIQDTNSLAMRALPYTVGHCVRLKHDMVFQCIPRTPGSAIGCIVHLSQGSKHVVANVEYNVLDAFLPGGDKGVGPEGLSPFPGNTNTLVLRLAPYLTALATTKGQVPEYVAPKYGKSVHYFKSPTRIECAMEDISQLMPDPSKVSTLTVPAWMCFNPVKNNIPDAAAKVKAGLPPWSALHSEAEVYAYNVAVINAVPGCTVAASPSSVLTVGSLSTNIPARIVLSPSWLPTRQEAQRKLRPKVTVSADSTLVLAGAEIILEDVTLAGALLVRAVKGAKVLIKGISCRTAPWLLESEKAPIVGVKGFRVVPKEDATVLTYPTPGSFVYNGKNTPSKL